MKPVQENNLRAALALAAAGVKVFPTGLNRIPLFEGWQEIATTDADTIREWWARAPYALPAVPCGANGLIVVDADRHGGPDGVANFKELVTQHGGLPAHVPVVKTPRQGFHCYFKQPNGTPLGNGTGELPPGVDVRGEGGYVVAVGATLPNGTGWALLNGRPEITRAPVLPAWLEGLLREPRHEAPQEEPAGETSDERGRAYTLAALQEIENELATTREGERNTRLYKASFRLGTMAARGWLSEGEITDALL